MEMLSRAIQIAAEAHDGQVDKGGAPYVLHPLPSPCSAGRPLVRRLDPVALAYWQRRELTYPKFTRRMMPDVLDMASGAWDRCVKLAHAEQKGAA